MIIIAAIAIALFLLLVLLLRKQDEAARRAEWCRRNPIPGNDILNAPESYWEAYRQAGKR